MAGLIGIAVLIALFVLFPFITREREGGCSGKGCWKKKLGFGCGDCPLDQTPPPAGSRGSRSTRGQ